jgi:hypothetical protein
VTGEKMADSTIVMRSIQGFEMVTKGRMALVTKWIGALIQLFATEIEGLILERDQKIARLVAQQGNRELVLNSKKYHVLTECKIDLMGRISDHLLVVNS